MNCESTSPRDRARILVLLACRNGEPWIECQLKSIVSQEDVDVIVQVADDGSTDRTRDVICAFQEGDSRVRLRSREVPTGSAGGNFRQMFREATVAGFDFVALADQDDVWDSRKLATAVETLRRSGAAGYSCSVRSFWPDGRERVMRQSGRVRSLDFLFEGAGQGCTFVTTRELFEQIQSFCISHRQLVEQLHYHDWLIYLLARSWGAVWHFDSRHWMSYRQHAGNEIGSRSGIRPLARRLRLISRGWYKDQIYAALRIAAAATRDPESLAAFHRTYDVADSFNRRLIVLREVLVVGRRRLSDRLVLALAAILGWI